MLFTEVIDKISKDTRLKPDLLKSEKGNNFRAVSESAILDVLDPILRECQLFYTIEIKKSDLQIREAYGSKGKKLQFIATIEIRLIIESEQDWHWGTIVTEAVGMGIDDCDKAMGKAYTYAVKYALLKLFRLRFGDDTDFEASKPLLTEKPKEEVAPKEEKKEKTPAKSPKKDKKEPVMTESQRDFILGLMEQKGIQESTIIGKYHVEPSYDEEIPMKTARAIIEWLQQQDDLPF